MLALSFRCKDLVNDGDDDNVDDDNNDVEDVNGSFYGLLDVCGRWLFFVALGMALLIGSFQQ